MKTLEKPEQKQIVTRTKEHQNLIDSNNYNATYFGYELKEMLAELIADESIKSKSQLLRNREYSSSKYYKMQMKFNTNPSVQELIKKIEDILESRLVEQGLSGKSIPMTIFLLKNYYGYTDQYQQQIDQSISFKVSRGSTRPVIDVTPTKLPNKKKT